MQPIDPFNVTIQPLPPEERKLLTPVTRLDIFENQNSPNFHPEGLFSTEIFGKAGDPERDTRFSYIDIHSKILHPILWQRLEKVKRFYIDILLGKAYARWNDETKQFEQADEETGQTGYAFFMKHWPNLYLEPGESEIRKKRVELLNKFRKQGVLDAIYVMPAGLRDAEVDHEGRVQEDEINPLYRKLLSISRSLTTQKANDSTNDVGRVTQQRAFNEIYSLIESMLTGKKGFIQGKWGRRAVMDGTRNVITAMDISRDSLDDDNFPGPDDTVLGLWQLSRAAKPITINRLRTQILDKVFQTDEGGAYLIDPKSMKPSWVDVKPKTFDDWTTSEGLEKLIAHQSIEAIRSKPVMVEGRYLMLVYKPKNRNVFKLFQDIEDLPEDYSTEDVYPLTYMELIYLCNYAHWNDLRCIVTRYPVEGENSTYPSKVFLRTTVNSEVRVELDENWQEPGDEEAAERTALVYPTFDPEAYIDSTMVHSYRLDPIGGD